VSPAGSSEASKRRLRSVELSEQRGPARDDVPLQHIRRSRCPEMALKVEPALDEAADAFSPEIVEVEISRAPALQRSRSKARRTAAAVIGNTECHELTRDDHSRLDFAATAAVFR
jgi:hypothetical protein